MEFEFTLTPNEDDISTLYQGLEAYNNSHHPELEEEKIGCFARDAAGTIIGGLYGLKFSNTLFIKYLWVSEQHRHQNIGKQLMESVESEAGKQGITDLFVDTYSFQAPMFYERFGFEKVGMYTGFPTKGVDRIFFQKSITSQ